MTDTNDYEEIRGGYRAVTRGFLLKLKDAVKPLEESFCMITGDCCCGSCSSYEVGDEMDEEGKPYGLYWHVQDEDTLDEYGDGLYIGFLANTDEESAKAADIIVNQLISKGFDVVWDRDIAHRIYVKAGPG